MVQFVGFMKLYYSIAGNAIEVGYTIVLSWHQVVNNIWCLCFWSQKYFWNGHWTTTYACLVSVGQKIDGNFDAGCVRNAGGTGVVVHFVTSLAPSNDYKALKWHWSNDEQAVLEVNIIAGWPSNKVGYRVIV